MKNYLLSNTRFHSTQQYAAPHPQVVAASAGSDSESALVGVVAAPMLIDRFLRQSRVWRWLRLRPRSSVDWSIPASTNAVSSLMDVLHYSNFVEPVRVATYLSHPLRTAAPYAPKAGVAVPWLFAALRNLFAAPSGCLRRPSRMVGGLWLLLSAACRTWLCAVWSTADVGAGVAGAGARGSGP